MNYQPALGRQEGRYRGAIYELVEASELGNTERRRITSLRVFSYVAYIAAAMICILTIAELLRAGTPFRYELLINAVYALLMVYIARASGRSTTHRANVARMRVLMAKDHRFTLERYLKSTDLEQDGEFDRLSARVGILCDREPITTPGFMAFLRRYFELLDAGNGRAGIRELDTIARQALDHPAGSRIRQEVFVDEARCPPAAVAADCEPGEYDSGETRTEANQRRPR